MLRRVDYASIPGVGYSGPFADITLKELKAWLGKGVIIHIPDPRGNTHLHRAVTEGAKPFVIEFLLKRGVDIDARNDQGETALIIAAWYGREELVELLLTKGADSNVKTRNGLTALKVAKANGYDHIVKKLLGHGAKSGRRPTASETGGPVRK
jgi:ankyrin repeat protein